MQIAYTAVEIQQVGVDWLVGNNFNTDILYWAYRVMTELQKLQVA